MRALRDLLLAGVIGPIHIVPWGKRHELLCPCARRDNAPGPCMYLYNEVGTAAQHGSLAHLDTVSRLKACLPDGCILL